MRCRQPERDNLGNQFVTQNLSMNFHVFKSTIQSPNQALKKWPLPASVMSLILGTCSVATVASLGSSECSGSLLSWGPERMPFPLLKLSYHHCSPRQCLDSLYLRLNFRITALQRSSRTIGLHAARPLLQRFLAGACLSSHFFQQERLGGVDSVPVSLPFVDRHDVPIPW